MNNYPHPLIGQDEIQSVLGLLYSGKPLSGFTGTPMGHAGGEYVRRLEDAFCEYFNVSFAVAMNSATSCLHAALLACDIHMGDEVIVSPFSFSSSASCVLMANAIPVFADIDEMTFCMRPDAISRAITPRTKAIIPVHLCGHPADMEVIMEIARSHHLKVIEDSAQAIGAEFQGEYTGTIGDCGVFSFNQSKHISTGEGGMLITNTESIAERARAVRNHGEVAVGGELGYNYRMTEMEAALVLPQLKKLNKNIERRIELADELACQLGNFDGIVPPFVRSDCKHVYYTFAMKWTNTEMMHRDQFQQKMLERGVYFGKGYVKPLYLLPIYQKRMHDIYRWFGTEVSYAEGLCPVAERMWKDEIMVTDKLRLPMQMDEVYDIVDVVKQIYQQ